MLFSVDGKLTNLRHPAMPLSKDSNLSNHNWRRRRWKQNTKAALVSGKWPLTAKAFSSGEDLLLRNHLVMLSSKDNTLSNHQ